MESTITPCSQAGVHISLQAKAQAWAHSPHLQNIIRNGVDIHWKAEAPHRHHHITTSVLPNQRDIMLEWLKESLALGYIRRLRQGETLQGSYRLFPIPKEEPGKYRIIHDLSPLNDFCQARLFQMEGPEELRALLGPQCWLTKLDFKAAFNHLTLAKDAIMWFGFEIKNLGVHWDGQYVDIVMPFGWTESPAYWDQIGKAIARRLRERGLTIVLYVDYF